MEYPLKYGSQEKFLSGVDALSSWVFFMSKKQWCGKKCQTELKSVMFSPWNTLDVKNLNYQTWAYHTIINYYRENRYKALKH